MAANKTGTAKEPRLTALDVAYKSWLAAVDDFTAAAEEMTRAGAAACPAVVSPAARRPWETSDRRDT